MTLPTIGKILSVIILTLLAVLIIFFSSCGSTKSVTKVHNNADGMGLTVTQSTNGSTISVDLKPTIQIDSSKLNIK